MKLLSNASNSFSGKIFNVAVLVAALGYFVDIYDLVLFSTVRIKSLQDLGLQGQTLTDHGIHILNMQMIGMLLGGILWGMMGDKRGRISVLFGSIFLYSLANLANAFVQTPQSYAIWRFIAGIGLAGELGAGITLVSETLPKDKRGYGTMIVATVGVSGAVVAGIIAHYFNWRTAYILGGCLGFALLALRIGVHESGMFSKIQSEGIQRGSFFSLFNHRKRFYKYLLCILIGLPTWYVIGVLVTLGPEFSKALSIQGPSMIGLPVQNTIDVLSISGRAFSKAFFIQGPPIKGEFAIMCCYAGLVLGDFLSGFLSQKLKSRKRIVIGFLLLASVVMGFYFSSHGQSSFYFYTICTLLGVTSGYWAIFVTIGAEQFGTNLRATVATTVPNFARGALVPINLVFVALTPALGQLHAGLAVGVTVFLIALIAAFLIEDSFDKDLNYLEEIS